VGIADGSCGIKLQVNNQQRWAWVALSHCWGSAEQYSTTTANLDDHRKAIRFEGFLTSERQLGTFDPDLNYPQDNLDHINIRPITFCPDFSLDTPLSERAWTLQEDILSSRTLHYTKEQLLWECQACKYAEGDISDREIRGNNGIAAMKRFFYGPEHGDLQDSQRALCTFDPFDVMHRW
jgi:hypothetical protein